VPAGTPRDLIARLYADVSKVLKQPDVRERIHGMGADVVGSTPEQFAAFMRAETAKWLKVVKQANIRLQ
jgi:tripartite-type tricarboxylate transporter receptor subunit TctC